MPKPKQSQERTWEYDFNITFNGLSIIKFTITDHYLEKHAEAIDNKLIYEIVKKLDGEELDPEPKKESGKHEVYVWERIPHAGKNYRLIFWFKHGSNDHLWIRNCYPID